MTERSRLWAWTINSRDSHPHEIPTAPELTIGVNGVLYYKYQMEAGATGRKHIQGCIRFQTVKSMEQVKSVLGCPWVHLEKSRNWKALVDYCGKEETRIGATVEEGNSGEQGKRTDLMAVASGLRSGMTCKQIAEQYPETYMRYPKGVHMLAAALHEPRRRDNLQVFCLHGETGVGKSHFIHKYFPDCYVLAENKNPWMDGYNQEKVVVFEEYGPNQMSINSLKRYLDIYKCNAPVKGGFVPWNPELIFITTNSEMARWYDPASVGEHDFAALQRRMTWITLGRSRSDNEKLLVITLRSRGIDIQGADHIVNAAPTAVAANADAGDAVVDMAPQAIPETVGCLSQHSGELLRTDFVDPTLDDMVGWRD